MNRAEDLFHRAWSGRPDGIWAAPGRVNLIGEHTDYNNGLVFPWDLATTAQTAVATAFHDAGFAAPDSFTVVPSAGARRID